SVMIDHFRRPDALDLNMKLEFERNAERYQFMKWGMQAFDTFKVVPPGIGIVHQVNLEYLARGVHRKDGVYYPDTLVGTDSHTTMIDRKSTRLNSSHVKISYAVFCLKQKRERCKVSFWS